MSRLFTLLAILTVCIPMKLAAQSTQTPSNALVVDDLFTLQENQNQGSDFVTKAVFYHLNEEGLRQLNQEQPFAFQLQLPLPNKEVLTLNLQQQQILADGFKVTTPDGEVPFTSGLFYKGTVPGDKNSHIAISLFKNHIVGFLTYDGATHELGHLEPNKFPAGRDYIFYNIADMLIEKTFECQTDDATFTPTPNDNREPASVSAADKVVKIYIEADYDSYQTKGNSVQNVVDYIEGFFAEVAVLYVNESINIQISEIFVWTTQDPYTTYLGQNIDGNFGSIYAFQPRMQSSGFNGNIAHLVQMVSAGNDGIAFIDELCDNNPYAYSDIESSYLNYPTVSWTTRVFAHENGHVIASPHTAACEWGPNGNQKLDNCAAAFGEGVCNLAPNPEPNTIMSYCNFTSYTEGFGDQPGDLLRNRVMNGTCLDDLTLPLDMVHFKGTVLEKGNQLTWTTANELNTKWHSIERSVDGQKGFVEIGQLAAAGFSTQQQQYTWLDEQPLAAAYYRIKTLDADGAVQFSDIIRLERKMEATGFGITALFPVPAKEEVQLQFNSTQNQTITIQLIDVTGRLIRTLSQKSTAGLNTVELNLSDVAAGLYVLQLTDEQGQQLMKNLIKE